MKYIIILVGLLFAIQYNYAQQTWEIIVEENQDKTFVEITEKIEEFYSTRDKGKGSGYKHYLRWKSFNAPRLDEEGKLVDVSEVTFDNFMDYQDKVLNNMNTHLKNSSISGNWQSVEMSRVDDYINGGPGFSGSYEPDVSYKGRFDCVVLDPDNTNILYAGGVLTGLWRSKDAGNSWECINDGLPCTGVIDICIDAQSDPNNRTLYLLSGLKHWSNNYKCVFVSYDGGDSWYSTSKISVGQNAEMVINPDNGKELYVISNAHIFKTTNGGLTWNNVAPGSSSVKYHNLLLKPGDPSTIYATKKNGELIISNNKGVDWTNIPCQSSDPDLTGEIKTSIAIPGNNHNVVFISYTAYPSSGNGVTIIYKSIDGGNTFTYIAKGSNMTTASYVDSDIIVSPDQQVIFIGHTRLHRYNVSTNTFVKLLSPQLHADVRDFCYIGNTLYISTDGGIVTCDDWANTEPTYYDICRGMSVRQIYYMDVDPVSDDRIIMGTQDNGHSVYDGTGVEKMIGGGDGYQCIISPLSKHAYYRNNSSTLDAREISNFQGYRIPLRGFYCYKIRLKDSYQYNNGIRDVLIANLKDQTSSIRGIYELTYDHSSSGPEISCRLLREYNNGIKVHVAQSNRNKLYCANYYNKLMVSNTGGDTWLEDRVLPMSHCEDIAVAHDNENKLCAYKVGYEENQKVWVSYDEGTSWINISNGLPNLSVTKVVYQGGSNNVMYAAMDIGVYYRDDNIGKWIPFHNGLPYTMIKDLVLYDHSGEQKLYAGTFGRGVWVSDLYNTSCGSTTIDLTNNNLYPEFSDYISGSNTFFTQNQIIADQPVASFSDVSFIAGQQITLKKGFSVSRNTVANGVGSDQVVYKTSFYAAVKDNPCTGSVYKSSGEAYEIKGVYAGPMPGLVERTETDMEEGELTEEESLRFYPNPTTSNITLEFNVVSEEPVSITVLNMLGGVEEEIVVNRFFDNGSYELNYDLGHLKNGVYILRYINGSNTSTQSLVIQK